MSRAAPQNPRRLRRHHAAEPRADRRRRAVRHTRIALSGRIDLGLGRAPGTDQRTVRALRRDPAGGDNFPQDVLEVQAFLAPVQPGRWCRPCRRRHQCADLDPRSSTFGAQVAAMLGLPYAFASHFAPDQLLPALEVYRSCSSRRSSRTAPMPWPASTSSPPRPIARRSASFTSAQQAFTNMLRGTRGKLQPPIDDIETYWSPLEKAHASGMLKYAFVGSADTVRRGLERFIEATGVDELIVASAIYDHAARCVPTRFWPR